MNDEDDLYGKLKTEELLGIRTSSSRIGGYPLKHLCSSEKLTQTLKYNGIIIDFPNNRCLTMVEIIRTGDKVRLKCRILNDSFQFHSEEIDVNKITKRFLVVKESEKIATNFQRKYNLSLLKNSIK